MTEAIPEPLISELEIQQRVGEIAAQIDQDFKDKGPLILIGVLKGAFILLADLSRKITVRHSVEFVAISSYGHQGAKGGATRLLMDVNENIEDRHVIIVEDILDTGNTLDYLISLLKARRPASLKTCVLTRKKGRLQVDVPIDYFGFEIPDAWVVGYGLDFDERHRTLPYIGVVHPDAD